MIANDVKDEGEETTKDTVDTIGLMGGIFAGIGATFASAMIILKVCFITKPGQHPDWPTMSVKVWLARWKKMENQDADMTEWKRANAFTRKCKEKA
eukprot:SAG11_NODE_32003_length_287_cov_0.819149_1_plen_95_part_11